MKTGLDIEKDIYMLVKADAISTTIKGTVYRNGQRLDNALTEDIVVSYLTGVMDDDFNDGYVNINVYVPYMVSKNGQVKDIGRCNQMETLLATFAKNNRVNTDYFLKVESVPQTFKVDGILQNMVNLKLRYKITNF